MKNLELFVSPSSVKRLNTWKIDIQNLYKPYLTVRDVNKVGRRHCLFCTRQQREVHLLSDGELRAYNILLAKPGTIAVMEQYALDLDDTIEIAERLKFLHPRKYKSGEAIVMTTDFVVDRWRDSAVKRIAYTFKYVSQVFKDENSLVRKPMSWRTWQKFEIERHYWSNRGVEYRLITEKHATKEQFWNLQFCENSRDLKVSEGLLDLFLKATYKVWLTNTSCQLQILCAEIGRLIGVTSKYAMQLFKYAVYHDFLLISHKTCLRHFRPVSLMPIV